MPQNFQLGQASQRLQPHREFVGRVLAGVVENRDLFYVLPHLRRDPFQHLGEGSESVISDDQNADALAAILRQRRLVLEQSAAECG